jgi:hypothetical protein
LELDVKREALQIPSRVMSCSVEDRCSVSVACCGACETCVPRSRRRSTVGEPSLEEFARSYVPDAQKRPHHREWSYAEPTDNLPPYKWPEHSLENHP